MSNNTFSYIYYRHIPNVFFKQKLKEIHRQLKGDLISLGIKNGILVSIFALGCDSKCTEIIFIKSCNKLSIPKLNEIVNVLLEQEISIFGLIKNKNQRCRISCYGISSQYSVLNTDFFKYLNKNFTIWENYSVKSFAIDKIKIEENDKIDDGELAYIGFVSSNISIESSNDLLSVKLLEEIFNLQNSILNEIRNLGLCYTTVSKFHEDLNTIYTGIVVSHSKGLNDMVRDMFSKVQISKNTFTLAKDRLKKEIIFSTTLYQTEHYLLPYQILNPNVDIPQLLSLTDKVEFEKIIQMFNNRKFVCLKI